MRKFLFCLCVFGLFFLSVNSWADSNLDVGLTQQELGTAGVDAGFDQKHRWSLGALGDTMNEMFHGCSRTDMIQLTDFSNWLAGRDGLASLRELANHCLNIRGFQNNRIVRGKKSDGVVYDCKVPEKNCSGGKCGEREYTLSLTGKKNSECDIFLSTFIKKHNQIATTKTNAGVPGTYVVPTHITDVYQVVDVILAPGYIQNGKINQAVNTDPNNTKIYVLSGGRAYNVVGLRTWTNDMFLNLNSVDGNRGVLNKSYICAGEDRDVTTDLYARFNSFRGTIRGEYTTYQGINLLPGMGLDTKVSLAKYCKFKAQSDIDAHTNGVPFEGKIANLEWLGHYVYGMIRDEVKALGDGAMNKIRDLLQLGTNGDSNESEKHQAAADLGARNQRAVNLNINRSHASDEYDNVKDGVCRLMRETLTKWGNLNGEERQSIECISNCNTGLDDQDVVMCFYRKYEPGVPVSSRQVIRQEYIVDDLADGWFDFCESMHLKAADCGIR